LIEKAKITGRAQRDATLSLDELSPLKGRTAKECLMADVLALP
jgi:hypothetical protein